MLRLKECVRVKRVRGGGVWGSRRVQRKYRRRTYERQRHEYERLRAVIPAVAEHPDAEEVDVVEAAIDYIEHLHQQIVHRMLVGALTTDLNRMKPFRLLE